MKVINWLLVVTAISLEAKVAAAQTKQPPTAVSIAFANMFPDAQNINWREKTTNFTVYFTRNDRKCEVKYEKNGGWLSTEEFVPWDSLPRPIQDSFRQGKYADWTKISAYSLKSAKDPVQYHLVITKDNQGRKILFFDPEGKLAMND